MELSKKVKISYGVGAIGKDVVYAFVAGFLLYYFNVVLGVSATFVGFLFMIARVFDAFNDPFMGIMVEKTKSRFGKFRPWIFIGTVLNSVILYAMYAVPEAITGTPLIIYISVCYLLWGITYTIMDIPYWAMIPAITESGQEREKISVIARSCAGIGFAIPTALTMVLVKILGDGNERIGFALLGAIFSLFFIMSTSITVLNVKEKRRNVGKTHTVREMLGALIQNDQALVVVIAIIIFNSSLYVTQNLALYFFQFDIGNAALFGVFGTVGGGAQIVAMTTLPLLRKKFDRSKIFMGAILTAISGYAFLFILGMLNITNLVLLCVAAIIIFIGFGLATVLTTIFLADTVDYGEWKTKQRNESVIFSLQTFVVKLASAISGFIAGVGIDLIGLDKDAMTQAPSTLMGLRFLMIVVPIIGLVAAILIFHKKYRLNEKYVSQITEELKSARGE
jgi:melibiose permease